MDLKLAGQRFIVCGASSGFGKAIATTLLEEGARCITVARRGDRMKKDFAAWEDQVDRIEGDLTDAETVAAVLERVDDGRPLHGAVINAGGPPTGTALETKMEQWDEAYQLVMRWKIDLALKLAPLLTAQKYGRILFIESKSVKEPIPALVLSNSFRAAVVGFAKSLALEIANTGVTVNVIAPGLHDTPARERLVERKSSLEQISMDQARRETERTIPVGRAGRAGELAGLAAWLLSSHSSYMTGQTIGHDGGAISGIFG